MEAGQREVMSLSEQELDAISGGRVCNQGPPRMEAQMQLGASTLVIWATASCHGTYWK